MTPRSIGRSHLATPPRTHSSPQISKAGVLTRDQEGTLVPKDGHDVGEPRMLQQPSAANLQLANNEAPVLNAPMEGTLGAFTSDDEVDEWVQTFDAEPASAMQRPIDLTSAGKVIPDNEPRQMPTQARDQPGNLEFFDERSLDLTTASKQTTPGTPIGVEPAVTQAELKEARDVVTQGRAELNMQQKALKLETRASLFMAGMQAFVDKLARKYGLKDHAVLPLKQMFAHAEQKLQHRVERRMQQVEQASTTLEDHTRQATYLSSLARGDQSGNAKEKPVQTHPPQAGSASIGAQTQGLDDVLALIDDTERSALEKACQLGQEIINDDAKRDSIAQGGEDGGLAQLALWGKELEELENQMKLDDSSTDEVAPLETSAKANPKLPSEMKPGEFVAFAQQQITDRPTRVR